MESLVMPNTPWWQRQVAMRTHRPQRRRGIKEWAPDRRPPPLGTARPVVARIIRKGRQPMARKTSSTSSKGKSKVHKVMKEHKEGKLKSGSGKKVKSRKQAVAIALSEARKSGAKIPKKKKKS